MFNNRIVLFRYCFNVQAPNNPLVFELFIFFFNSLSILSAWHAQKFTRLGTNIRMAAIRFLQKLDPGA